MKGICNIVIAFLAYFASNQCSANLDLDVTSFSKLAKTPFNRPEFERTLFKMIRSYNTLTSNSEAIIGDHPESGSSAASYSSEYSADPWYQALAKFDSSMKELESSAELISSNLKQYIEILISQIDIKPLKDALYVWQLYSNYFHRLDSTSSSQRISEANHDTYKNMLNFMIAENKDPAFFEMAYVNGQGEFCNIMSKENLMMKQLNVEFNLYAENLLAELLNCQMFDEYEHIFITRLYNHQLNPKKLFQLCHHFRTSPLSEVETQQFYFTQLQNEIKFLRAEHRADRYGRVGLCDPMHTRFAFEELYEMRKFVEAATPTKQYQHVTLEQVDMLIKSFVTECTEEFAVILIDFLHEERNPDEASFLVRYLKWETEIHNYVTSLLQISDEEIYENFQKLLKFLIVDDSEFYESSEYNYYSTNEQAGLTPSSSTSTELLSRSKTLHKSTSEPTKIVRHNSLITSVSKGNFKRSVSELDELKNPNKATSSSVSFNNWASPERFSEHRGAKLFGKLNSSQTLSQDIEPLGFDILDPRCEHNARLGSTLKHMLTWAKSVEREYHYGVGICRMIDNEATRAMQRSLLAMFKYFNTNLKYDWFVSKRRLEFKSLVDFTYVFRLCENLRRKSNLASSASSLTSRVSERSESSPAIQARAPRRARFRIRVKLPSCFTSPQTSE